MDHSQSPTDASTFLQSRWQDDSLLMDNFVDQKPVDDLSLSELSVNDLPAPPPPLRPTRPKHKFSLLAQPGPFVTAEELAQTSKDHRPDLDALNEDEELEQDEDQEEYGHESKHIETLEDEDKQRRLAARAREERLQHDLFVLRKLNSAFAVYHDALRDTRSSTERVQEQLEQTNALLDQYVRILGGSEAITRVIFDERWHGADEDEKTINREIREAQEKARREEQERLLAAKREVERLEREARERQERQDKERIEAEKREKLALRAGYGGVRGARGARARGGALRIAPTSGIPTRGRASSVSTTTMSRAASGRLPRPSSSVSTQSTTTSTVSSRTGTR